MAYGLVQNAALADDVVQEAALVALSKLDQFRPGSDFAAWMARIVRYVGLNQARAQRRRRVAPLDTAPQQPAGPPAPPDLGLAADGQLPADQEWFGDRVTAALRRVAATPRICLLLRTVERLTYPEIAKLLRIPEGTAMSHVHRARMFLRKELADVEPTLSGERQSGV